MNKCTVTKVGDLNIEIQEESNKTKMTLTCRDAVHRADWLKELKQISNEAGLTYKKTNTIRSAEIAAFD
jgi:hypothetical protein